MDTLFIVKQLLMRYCLALRSDASCDYMILFIKNAINITMFVQIVKFLV